MRIGIFPIGLGIRIISEIIIKITSNQIKNKSKNIIILTAR